MLAVETHKLEPIRLQLQELDQSEYENNKISTVRIMKDRKCCLCRVVQCSVKRAYDGHLQ
jgi:hypothetical protein